MTRRWMLLITSAALLAGCGGKKDDEPAKTGSATAPAPDEETASKVLAKPRKAISGRAGTVEFTIDLPEEASAPRAAADGATFDFKGSALQISVTAVASPLGADELTKKRALLQPGEELLRADEVSAGAYVISKIQKDRTGFLFEHCRNIPYGHVCCAATMHTAKSYREMDGVITSVTDVCQHVTVNGEPHAAPATLDSTRPQR